MTLRQPVLGIVVGVGVLVLSLVGAGVYVLLPLAGDAEQRARHVVEEFVAAWADGRCAEAAGLVGGTADLARQACLDSAGRRRGDLVLEDLDLRIDGARGTADLHLVVRDGEAVERSTITQGLVRRDGAWRVLWSPA